MHRYTMALCASLTLLCVTPAQANHCAYHLANVQTALSFAESLDSNRLTAAGALLEEASKACQQEETQMTYASLDSPMLAPDYVSVGQSMLIDVKNLLSSE
ncbi:hypothetical protein AAFN46_10515 [Pseudomonas sp. CAU 1711]|uniref:hypothetical protein n=1 Tax=Pseudomonas sp. CAU 1711 TaxID=3140356 RepID=UPI0032607A19